MKFFLTRYNYACIIICNFFPLKLSYAEHYLSETSLLIVRGTLESEYFLQIVVNILDTLFCSSAFCSFFFFFFFLQPLIIKALQPRKRLWSGLVYFDPVSLGGAISSQMNSSSDKLSEIKTFNVLGPPLWFNPLNPLPSNSTGISWRNFFFTFLNTDIFYVVLD